VEESKSQGLKPDFVVVFNAWAKAQAYLRSKSKSPGLKPLLGRDSFRGLKAIASLTLRQKQRQEQ